MVKTGLKPIDELILLAKEGNGFAFTALWDRHIEQLRSYIKLQIKRVNYMDVDDICSRSFEKAFRQIHNYNPSKSQFFTWLKTIAKNTALDMIDIENRVHPKEQYLSLDDNSKASGAANSISYDSDTPLDNIIKDEDTQENENYINGLPEIYREPARKRIIEGMNYKEIAEELNLELNTVKTRIRRAKAQIEKIRKEKENEI